MILSFPPGTPQKTSDRVTEKVHTLLQSGVVSSPRALLASLL